MKIEEIIITHLLEMAKERQKEVNHLNIGNYVVEHYLKITMVIQEMKKSNGGWTYKDIRKALEDIL